MNYTFINADNSVVDNNQGWSGLISDLTYRAWVAEGNTAAPYIAPPAAPLTATPLQFRLGLSQAGIRAAVEAWIPTANQAIQDAYKYASVFVETDPLVTGAAAQFNLTTDQVHALFITMQTLSP